MLFEALAGSPIDPEPFGVGSRVFGGEVISDDGNDAAGQIQYGAEEVECQGMHALQRVVHTADGSEPVMAKRLRKAAPKKRNLTAKAAKRSAAGPMKDKREVLRQERKTRDRDGNYE